MNELEQRQIDQYEADLAQAMAQASLSSSDSPENSGENSQGNGGGTRGGTRGGGVGGYWRSLAEREMDEDFRKQASSEFSPSFIPESVNEEQTSQGGIGVGGVNRRRFLQVMAASLAAAGLTGTLSGCRREEYHALPYNQMPTEIVEGKPLFYATTLTLGAWPIGVLAQTYEGRPTKLEGNPLHPTSGGALHAFAQASILDLYDPDRSKMVLKNQVAANWDTDALAMLDQVAQQAKANQGESLAILMRDHASPAIDMLREHLQKTLPKAKVYQHEPLAATVTETAEYDLSQADVIVSLDSDLLGLEDQGVSNKRAFGRRRQVVKPSDAMNRLYVVEPVPTVTGMAADHRLSLPTSRVVDLAIQLAQALGTPMDVDFDANAHGIDMAFVRAVADDLKKHAGRCVVAAGHRQPPLVHALARLMNQHLKNSPKVVRYTQPVSSVISGDLHDLAKMIAAGQVQTLVMLNVNPVYDAPADLDFAAKLKQVPQTIHLGYYVDETAALSQWHLPATHELESWSDAQVGESLSPVQPMIAPLFGGHSELEILARLIGYPQTEPYAIAQASFARATGSLTGWKNHLHRGVTSKVKPRVTDAPAISSLGRWLETNKAKATPVGNGNIELVFAGSMSVYDGRYANNGWLQETPDPFTKLTWDNAAILSPNTAKTLNVQTGDWLEITIDGRTLAIPANVLPGVADGVISIALGYGRTKSGTLGNRAGFNAYAIRTSRQPWVAPAQVKRIGNQKKYALATTQDQWAIQSHELIQGVLADRAIVREATLDQFNHHPDFAKHQGVHVPHHDDIAPGPKLTATQQWGLAVDLSACIGCNACSVACQAENNIPIVGKNEVIRGRHMGWLRIDRYFRGPLENVSFSMQPMMCHHCENAPCEPVCPVNATVHDEQGLNAMVYNRCVGTRYCSNNCPYKVRRFNYYDYNKGTLRTELGDKEFDGVASPDPTQGFSLPQLFQPPMQETLKMQKNPQVTVRMRGVMEKCTYCVQRIQNARIESKVASGQSKPEPVADGVIQTACQQSCPTQAIVFGDIADPTSRVSQLRANSRNYSLLDHLNTKPRTTYLARITNPNPALKNGSPVTAGH